MASKDVCEIRLVMATALTRRVKTVKRFPVQQPAANPCAGQPFRAGGAEYRLPAGTRQAGTPGKLRPGRSRILEPGRQRGVGIGAGSSQESFMAASAAMAPLERAIMPVAPRVRTSSAVGT